MVTKPSKGPERLSSHLLAHLRPRVMNGVIRLAKASVFSVGTTLREMTTAQAFLLALFDALAASDIATAHCLLEMAENIELLRSSTTGVWLRDDFMFQKEEVRQVLVSLDTMELKVPVHVGLVFSALAENYMISGNTSMETTITNEGEDCSSSSPSKDETPELRAADCLLVKRCLGLPETATPSDLKAAARRKDDEGYCLLHRLSEAGHQDSVEELLRAGVPWDQRGPEGQTPVHCAALNGQISVLEVLCRAGADLTTHGAGGAAPIHLAASAGHAATVRWLAKHGADIRCKNKDGQTPLHSAALGGHVDVIKTLKELDDEEKRQMSGRLGAVPRGFFGPDQKDEDGCTPLHLAVSAEQYLAAQTLVEDWKADMRLSNNQGATPLHLAARADMGKLVKTLVDWGADLGAVTIEGHTPLDEAVTWAASGAEEVIRQLGGVSAKKRKNKKHK